MGDNRQERSRLAMKSIDSLFPYPQGENVDENERAGLLQHATSVLAHCADFPELMNIRNTLKYGLALDGFEVHTKTSPL
jgi:hypothetical protein